MSVRPASLGLVFQPFSETAIDSALEISHQLRWTHRVDDCSLAAHTGCGVVVKEGERLVGTALCWPMERNMAARSAS